MEQWFEGKVAVVTGGGAGIGRAAAMLFALRGAKVVVADVRQVAANETTMQIVNAGGQAIAVVVDVTDDTAVAGLIKSAIDNYGRLDCAFNNAGVTLKDDENWSDSTTRQTFDVNVFGVMACIRHEVPAMLRTGGGTIVNTASLLGLVASRLVFQPAYVASKHAVVGVTKVAALQYARENIRVNALCPGVTRTALVEEVMSRSAEIRARLESHSPMGRVATPQEMAEAAIWLCSDKSSFVNGHALVVDGGGFAE